MENHLTALEWEIMNVIWSFEESPSVREVVDRAYPNKEKAYTTVQTIMTILVKKGYLQKRKRGMVNFYKPLKGRNDQVKGETEQFVNKVFDGSFLALANYLMNSKELSADEIDKLGKLISDKKEKK